MPNMLAIDDWVRVLTEIPAQEFEIDRVEKFVRDNWIRPETLTPYLFYAKSHYTRNLIYKSDIFEVLSICWDIGQVSRVHNHRDQNCWMVTPIGRLKVHYELLTRWNRVLSLTSVRTLGESVERHYCESVFAAFHQGVKALQHQLRVRVLGGVAIQAMLGENSIH